MKLTDYTKKEQEILKKENNLALCPNCNHIVCKTDKYCGHCGKRLFLIVSLTTSTKS